MDRNLPDKHQECTQSVKGVYPYPIAEKILLEKDQAYYCRSVNEIVFLIQGKLAFQEAQKVKMIEAGNMFFLKNDCPLPFTVVEQAEFIVFRLFEGMEVGSKCTFFRMLDIHVPHMNQLTIFKINQPVHGYISNLSVFMVDGLDCTAFLEIKLTELFYILKAYYPIEILADFFQPILIEKNSFTEFIINHYQQVKTVKELASLSNYSLSGFEKEFKKVFGIPAYQWILQKKKARIYHEVANTSKPLKVIMDEFGFSSLSQLSDFCRKHLHKSPSKIRNIKREMMEL